MEFVPQVLIEMIIETMGDKILESSPRREIIRYVHEYDDRKKREKHTIVKATVRDFTDQLPNYIK